MELVNKNARQRGRTIDFKEILYGYRRVNPLIGADFILDLLLIYRKHKGRKMTVQVVLLFPITVSLLISHFLDQIVIVILPDYR
jgi:hypothetical protein